MKIFSPLALFTLFFLAPSMVQASLIWPAPGASSSQNLSGVNILPAVITVVEDPISTLHLIGSGLRSKKVALASVKVYVAQVFAERPESFIREESKALDSLPSTGTLAIQLTFLRNVDASTVQNSFRDAFFANQIDPTKTQIAAFLEAVSAGGDATSGSTLTIRGRILPDGSQEIAYEGSRGSIKTIIGDSRFLREIFALWYGNPADSGLSNLRSSLLIKP